MVSEKGRFRILVALVLISGFSQGMLLPLIAVILEQKGISSSVNGLHATGLYIGVLLASPFMEKPLRTYGYKPIILTGGAFVFLSLFFFTLWESLWFWFMLRMLIGIGDHVLHFGTQTWITTTSEKHNRGRRMALYGLSFGLGFAMGPLMTRLIYVHPALPFLVSAILSLLIWGLLFFVRNEWPEDEDAYEVTSNSSAGRFKEAVQIAWIALLPPFAYGFLEATLHGNFPVYGMRIGHDVETLSLIIPAFAVGSLVTQLPLGVLSDKIGRKQVLAIVLAGGGITFFLAGVLEHSVIWLFVLFTLAGMLVGSIYSLGISYMTDMLPKTLHPAGNILCGISFSLGSITGPFLGGLFIQFVPGASFFYLITAVIFILFVLIMIKGTNPSEISNTA
ncbi:putative MFS family arabinose efflux permease [Melghiribacillus thermohalophilus]|uniref:Putative MFS family arabinose efflux permease n=1 Tax=Melghiribacillus thermohalophilus TaxID=1324956 RepID=A0A4V2V136_9BACI|nr:MFS transporter [Melghiribacillus thermohalophilus]TCT19642.1 putative MFS family arabinose efflux permease [Melghiribacillus thermohalophilus]